MVALSATIAIGLIAPETVLIHLLQFQPELTAFAGLGFHADFALHSFDCLSDYGQTDAGSFEMFGTMRAFEHRKNPSLVLLRNPNSIILETDPNVIVGRFRPYSNARRFS